MSAIVNDRDVLLQAAVPRLLPVNLSSSIYIPALKGIILSAAGTAFQVDPSGTPLPATITLTGSLKQVTGTIAFSVIGGAATLVTSVLSPTATACSIDYSGVTAFPVTIQAQVTDTDGTVYTSQMTFNKIQDGVAAKLLSLLTSSQVFQVAKSGTISPASITLSLNQQNLAGSPTFTVTSGTATLTGSGASRTLTYANMATDAVTVQVTQDGLTDTATLVKVREGADSLVGFLTNEAQTVPANSLGIVSSYVGAGGVFKVFRGTTDVTNLAAFSVVSNPDGVSFSLGASTGVFSVSAAGSWSTSSNVTTVTMQATYLGATLQKVFTITKSLSGTAGTNGADSTAYWLTRSVGAITLNTDATFTPSSITFNALAGAGAASPAAYAGRFIIATSSDGINFTTQYTSAADESAKTYTGWPANTTLIRVRLYLAGGTTTLLDESVAPIVVAGTNGLTAILSNASHTVPADNSGNVTNYVNSGTTVQVWEGATPLTYVTSAPIAGQFTIGTAVVNPALSITPGAYSGSGTTTATVAQHSGMSGTTPTLIITYPLTAVRANGAVATTNVVQTITKATAGANGTNGSNGSNGTRGSFTGVGTQYGIRATAWSDTLANRVIDNMNTGGTATSGLAQGAMTAPGLVLGDTVTLSNGNPWWTTQGTWASGTTYSPNAIVISSGIAYRALQTTTGNTPSSSATFWFALGTATSRGAWAASTLYSQNDYVTSGGTTYLAKWKHTSSSATLATDTSTVEWAQTKYWGGSSWLTPGTTLDGNLLVKGSISADFLNGVGINIGSGAFQVSAGGSATMSGVVISQSVFGNLWDPSKPSIDAGVSGGTQPAIKATAGGGNAMQVIGSTSAAALSVTAGSGQPAISTAGDIVGNASWTAGVYGKSASSLYVAIQADQSAAAGTALSAYNNGAGKQAFLATSGYSAYSPTGGGKQYFVDGAGPFTGYHPGLGLRTDTFIVGDIVVDDQILLKQDISNCLGTVVVSTAPNQKGVLGVVSEIRELGVEVTDDQRAQWSPNYILIDVNAIGEGLVNVCGEGGNIAKGDFIVTSSTPGKGMRQADDLMRNITVAKAREDVTFDSPNQVKQLACIYVSG